jgi:hypothetical protein
MSLTFKQITEEALALPASARSQLASLLIESLGLAEDVSRRQHWTAEAIRRRDEVRSGRTQAIPGDEAIPLVRKDTSV